MTIIIPPFLFGCSSKHVEHEIDSSKGPTQFSKLTDLETEVFPLPNGNAYLVSNTDQELYLLSGDKAKRIDNVVMIGITATVYTLPNGAAYLASADAQNLRLYYLVGDKATLVQEGAINDEAMQRVEKSSDAFLWAQTQAALLGKRRAITNAQTTTSDEKPE